MAGKGGVPGGERAYIERLDLRWAFKGSARRVGKLERREGKGGGVREEQNGTGTAESREEQRGRVFCWRATIAVVSNVLWHAVDGRQNFGT